MGTARSEDYPRWSLAIVTAPTTEPVTLTEAKNNLRVIHTRDDDEIEDVLIPAARQWCESYTRRTFITTAYKLFLERFPRSDDTWGPYHYGQILLPRPPRIGAVATVLTYTDTDGTSQTFATTKYRVTSGDEPTRVEPAYGQTWPSTRTQSEAINFTWSGGYGAASTVPAAIKSAILMMVASMYAYKESEITGTIISDVGFNVQARLSPYVLGWEF